MLPLPELMNMQNGAPVTHWAARRKEILHILEQNIYGKMPPVYGSGTGKILSREDVFCAGHAHQEDIALTVPTEKGEYTFPIHLFLPHKEEKVPLFVLLNFRADVYDKYYPLEEIMDNGFALAVIHYNDVTTDDGDMENGLAAHFTRPTDGTGFGKISLWAWAASRTLDYLLTRPEIDAQRTAIIGHSRLGKTALWCAAQDERFACAFSNDSGCAGAALERAKHPKAETVRIISDAFPFWFCENYRRYADNAAAMPFDQHFLLAAIAPRPVCVNSASLDLWADPYGEQLSCIHASPAWTFLGKRGYIGPTEQAQVGEHFHDGCVGYFLRDGIHFLGRADWLNDMAFFRKHV